MIEVRRWLPCELLGDIFIVKLKLVFIKCWAMFLANQSKNCDVKEKDSKNEHDNVNDDDEGCSFVTLLVDKVEEKSHENHANWNKEN